MIYFCCFFFFFRNAMNESKSPNISVRGIILTCHVTFTEAIASYRAAVILCQPLIWRTWNSLYVYQYEAKSKWYEANLSHFIKNLKTLWTASKIHGLTLYSGSPQKEWKICLRRGDLIQHQITPWYYNYNIEEIYQVWKWKWNSTLDWKRYTDHSFGSVF